MAITYNAGTNTITVTGYTEATPCNFTDIYNADVAGAWGVVTRQCTNQFCVSAQINVGDGSTTTYIGDENIFVTFIDFVPASGYEYIRIRNNGYARFGKLISGTKTRNGCGFRMLNVSGGNRAIFGNWTDYPNYYGNLKLYSCLLIGMKSTQPGQWGAFQLNSVTAYNTHFTGCGIYGAAVFDIQDFYEIAAVYGFIYISDTTPTIKNCRFYDITPGAAIYFNSTIGNLTVRDCVVKNSNYDFWITATTSATNHLYCVNLDVDRNWVFYYTGGASSLSKTYRQYEFDLHVKKADKTNFSSRPVTIWQKQGSTLFVDTDKIYTGITDVNGNIPTQTLTFGHYVLATGSIRQPYYHKILIEGDTDHLDYETEFEITAKKKESITLVNVSDIVDGIADIKGTGFVKDTDSMVNIPENVWDELLTGATHNIATSAGRRLRECSDVLVLREEETAQGGSLTTITLNASASAIDGFYDMSTLVIISGAGAGQARTFDDYNGATKVGVPCDPWTVAPDNTSHYIIRGHACTAVYKMHDNVYTKIWDEVKKLFPFLF